MLYIIKSQLNPKENLTPQWYAIQYLLLVYINFSKRCIWTIVLFVINHGFVLLSRISLLNNTLDAAGHLSAPECRALLCAQQSIVFHFDILLHDTHLTHDNEYGYLTDSSNVNKATPFQARARSFGVKISRYERQMLAGEIPRAEFHGVRTYNRRSEQSVHGKRGLRVIRIRYSHATTKQPSLDLCENGH